MLKAKQARPPKLEKVAPGVPKPLAKLIAQLMAPKAQDRPQSYQELFARFDAVARARLAEAYGFLMPCPMPNTFGRYFA